ncbi:MAG TPA: alpha/beta hydrolase [Kofleriaceae bacterium]|nr:alpha/beta hydrolase [Kofleriaceae bacterium]
MRLALALAIGLVAVAPAIAAPKIVKQDVVIDGGDPGVKLFVRTKLAAGARPARDNVVVFVHGATFPSTPDFDLQFQDYSWADWMASKGWVVVMFDIRNYGASSREPAMDKPAAASRPVSRSFQVVRDIGAVLDFVKARYKVERVALIGWSWGAMTAGYYASLHSERLTRLVMYAPLYSFAAHPNLGAGSANQDKRHPSDFAYDSLGAYRLGTAAANQARWDNEIPVSDKALYRDPAVVDAFNRAALATDPTSGTRNPPSLRAPNGVLEDSFYQATGRPLYNASSIYVPTLLIAGQYDTWSFAADREGLMRDLVNAPVKKSVVIPDATHFVLFEKHRFELFTAIDGFLRETP